MTASKLAAKAVISPYCDAPRNKPVKRVTIHHAVGLLSAEHIANILIDRQVSANYTIGADGEIVCGCWEENRPWTSSSPENDHQAITIECADNATPPYVFPISVEEALIKLLVDICERYKAKKLVWIPDKNKALDYVPADDEILLTVHNWFSPTACPGDYAMQCMPEWAKTVTETLAVKDVMMYRVQTGAFRNKENAERMAEGLKSLGYDTIIKEDKA